MEMLEAVEAAAARLGESTLRYWPTKIWNEDHATPYTEIPEAATLQYLAHFLMEPGRNFDVFAEVPLDLREGNGRVDLVGVRAGPTGHDVLAVEAKRLFSCTGADSLAADWERLRSATWANGVTIPQRGQPAVRFHAFLLATTWSDSIQDWWRHGLAGHPRRSRSKSWRALADCLEGYSTHTVEIADHGDNKQWLLLAGGLIAPSQP